MEGRQRGNPSVQGEGYNRAFAGKDKDRVIELYREKDKGFGPTLAAEKPHIPDNGKTEGERGRFRAKQLL